MKLNELDIIIIILFTFVFITSIWYIDISLSAVAVGSQLINLQGIQNPYDFYHVALAMNEWSFIGLVSYLLMRNHFHNFKERKVWEKSKT